MGETFLNCIKKINFGYTRDKYSKYTAKEIWEVLINGSAYEVSHFQIIDSL